MSIPMTNHRHRVRAIFLATATLLGLAAGIPLRVVAQYTAEALVHKQASDLYDQWGYGSGGALNLNGTLNVSASTGSVGYTYPISEHPIKGHRLSVALNYCGSVAFSAFKDYHQSSGWQPYQSWTKITQNRPAYVLGVNGFAIQVISTAWDFACDRPTVDDRCRKDYDDASLVWAVDGYDFCNRMEDFNAANYSAHNTFVDVIRLLRADGSILELRNAHTKTATLPANRPELYTGHYFVNEANASGFAIVEFDDAGWPRYLHDRFVNYGDHVRPRIVHYFPGDGLEYVFREWLTPFGARAYFDDPGLPRDKMLPSNYLAPNILGGAIAGPTVFYLERITSAEGLVAEFTRTRHVSATPDVDDRTRGRALITDFPGHHIEWGDGQATIEALGRTITLVFGKTLWSGERSELRSDYEPCPMGSFDRTDAYALATKGAWSKRNLARSAVGYVTSIVEQDDITRQTRITRFTYESYHRILRGFGFPHSGGDINCQPQLGAADIGIDVKNFRLKEVIEPLQRYELCYYNGAPAVMGAAATDCGYTATPTILASTPTTLERMNYPFQRNNVAYTVKKYRTDNASLLTSDTYTNLQFEYDPLIGDYPGVARYSRRTVTDEVAHTSVTTDYEFERTRLTPLHAHVDFIPDASFTDIRQTTVSDPGFVTTTTTTYGTPDPAASYLRLPMARTVAVAPVNGTAVQKSSVQYAYTVTTVRDYNGDAALAAKFGGEVATAVATTLYPGTAVPLRRDSVVYRHFPLSTGLARKDTMWDEAATRAAYAAAPNAAPFEDVAFADGVRRERIEEGTNLRTPPLFGAVQRTAAMSYDLAAAAYRYEGGMENTYETLGFNAANNASQGTLLARTLIGQDKSATLPGGTFDYRRWWSKSLPARSVNPNGAATEFFYDFLLPGLRRNDGTYRTAVGTKVRNDNQTRAYEFTNGAFYAHAYEKPLVQAAHVRRYDTLGALHTDTLATFTRLGCNGQPVAMMGPNGWLSAYDYDDAGRLRTAWYPFDFPRPSAVAGASSTGTERVGMHTETRRAGRADTAICAGGGRTLVAGPELNETMGGGLYAWLPRTVIPECPCPDSAANCRQAFRRERGHTGYLEYQLMAGDALSTATDLTAAYLQLYAASYSGPGCLVVVVESPELGISVPFVLGCSDRKLGSESDAGQAREKHPGAAVLTDDPNTTPGRYVRLDLMAAKAALLNLAPGATLHFTVTMKTADGYVNLTSSAPDARPTLVLAGTFVKETETVADRDDYTLAYDLDDEYSTARITAKVDDAGHTANVLPVTGSGGIRRTTARHFFGHDHTIRRSEIDIRDRNRAPRTDVAVTAHDGHGRVLSATDPNGVVTSATYDAYGRAVKQTNGDNTFSTAAYAVGAPAAFAPYTTGQDFYGFCSRVLTTDENGVKTARYYDAFDSLRCVVADHGGLEAITRFNYDAMGRLITTINPKGEPTGYTYDAFGRLVRKQQQDMGAISYAYDRAGNMRFTQTQAQAERAAMTFHEYDDLNRLTVTGEALIGAPPQNPNGPRLTEQIDPTVLHTGGSAPILTANPTLWPAPPAPTPAVWAAPDAHTVENCPFDPFPPLYETTVAQVPYVVHPAPVYAPSTVRAGTDNFENLSVYAAFARTAVAYDTLPFRAGAIWGAMPPDSLWNRLAPAGRVRNQRGHQAAVAYRTHGGEPFHYTVFSYDERERIEAQLRYTENLGFDAVYYTYNSMNQVVTVRTADPMRQHTSWYGYNDNGRADSVWDELAPVGQGLSPIAVPNTFQLDLARSLYPPVRPRPATAEIVYTYNLAGLQDTLRYPAIGAVTWYAYHPTRYWLAGITAAMQPAGLPQVKFTETLARDLAGRITGQTYKQHGQPTRQQLYTYDGLGRLTAWSLGGQITTYSYDPNGNRLGSGTNNPVTGISYGYGGTAGGPNRLAGAVDMLNGLPNGGRQYSYAPDGAVTGLTTVNAAGATVKSETFASDFRGLNMRYVQRAQNGDTVDFRYRYNAAGAREQKRIYAMSVPDNQQQYVWSYYLLGADQKQLALYNGRQTSGGTCNEGPGTRVYLYGAEYRTFGAGGQADMATRAGGEKEYVVRDHLGSPRLVLNATGLVNAYDYEPFGGIIPQLFSSGRRQDYIGNERDEESGLGNFGVRQYSYIDGRFLSTDPLWEKYPGMSPYHYSGNSPVSYSDGTGDTVRVSGNDAKDVVAALDAQTSLDLAMDADGTLSATGDAVSVRDKLLLAAINDPTIVVNLFANSDDIVTSTSQVRTPIIVGQYGGSKTGAGGTIQTEQFVNLKHMLAWQQRKGPDPGETVLHEVIESFIGGAWFPGKGYSRERFDAAHAYVMELWQQSNLETFSRFKPYSRDIIEVYLGSNPLSGQLLYRYNKSNMQVVQ